MEYKTCETCLEKKEIFDFKKVKNNKYYSRICRECYNARKRKGTAKILFTDGIVKECGTCRERKNINNFSMKNGKPGFRCKACHNKYYKEYYNKNKATVQQSVKKYKKSLGILALRASKYGITEEQLSIIINTFDGKCWICKDKEWYAVDHDHNCCENGSCGKCVRGVLCTRCNTLLGHAKDDPSILSNAALYLRERISLVL